MEKSNKPLILAFITIAYMVLTLSLIHGQSVEIKALEDTIANQTKIIAEQDSDICRIIDMRDSLQIELGVHND